MITWGALDINSRDAVREVLEHTVVASTADVAKLFTESREQLGIAWLVARRPKFGDTDNDPAAPLRWMAEIAESLHKQGAYPQWHGMATFVWPIDARTLESVAAVTTPVVTAGSVREISLRCGVAHGSEVADPGDLLRLAAYRSTLFEEGRELNSARPAMTSMEVALSGGEQARFAVISKNRTRQIDPLFRDALDLLIARYA
jgi:hypothetical protein